VSCIIPYPKQDPLASAVTKDPSNPGVFVTFRNKFIFYGQELLAPHHSTKLEYHLLLAV
jgi:hypothetical protein